MEKEREKIRSKKAENYYLWFEKKEVKKGNAKKILEFSKHKFTDETVLEIYPWNI